ncbi:MAG: SCO family protein [Planctomycetes bacterium]|nr:SCO family protein [Planctomycetota bacterium]
MGLLATLSLCRREIVRFYRQPSRVVGALGTPLVFWLLLGSGFGESFRSPGAPGELSFLEYFFPGAIFLTVLFASIFATISIIEDRHSGFLQGVVVAPVPRISIVLGKVLGGAALAAFQGALFLALAPAAGIALTLGSFLLATAWLGLVSVALTGLGFVFAWRMESVQGFHGVMNLVLMPMWMLSGAAFPIGGARPWLRGLLLANPLTYGVSGLRHILYPADSAVRGDLPPFTRCLAVTLAFVLATLSLSRWAMAARRLGSRALKRSLLWALLLAALALAAAGTARKFLSSREEESGSASPASEPIPVLGTVPPFELVDQDGRPVRGVDLAGKVWVADFIFTHCPAACSEMSSRMKSLAGRTATVEELMLVSFSVDPERDTPERLAEYARRFEAPAGRWIFLTGEKATLHRLAQEGFRVPVSEVPPAEVKPEIGPFLHSQRFVLVDARGRIRGYYDGTGAEDAGRLERDLRRVAAESKR